MRALTIIDVVLLVFSYIQSSTVHALVYDKLLRALIVSNWVALILICKEVDGVPHASQ